MATDINETLEKLKLINCNNITKFSDKGKFACLFCGKTFIGKLTELHNRFKSSKRTICFCSDCDKKFSHETKLRNSSKVIEYLEKFDLEIVGKLVQNIREKGTFRCKNGHVFETTLGARIQAVRQYNSDPCPICNNEKVKLRAIEQAIKKTEDFINKAKTKHGDKYDYSKVDYKSAHEKVTIICKKHGEFEQLPTVHLSGSGCPRCSSEQKIHKLEKSVQLDKLLQKYKLKVTSIRTNSYKKHKILCENCGLEWEEILILVKRRIEKLHYGCKSCKFTIDNNIVDYDKQRFLRLQEKLKQINCMIAENYYNGYDKKHEFQCLLCGYRYIDSPNNVFSKYRQYHHNGCPSCKNKQQQK